MLAAGALLLATPSCKKGENDPFMSLSSRKARVSGDWDVTNIVGSSTNTEADGDYQKTSSAMSGSVITTTYTNYDSGSSSSTTSTSTETLNDGSYMINKDGTWESTWNTTKVWTSTMTIFSITYTTTYTQVKTNTQSGNWSFVGKVKDEYKNKERFVMNTTSSSWSSQTTSVQTNSFDDDVDTVNGDLDAGTSTYHSGEWAVTYEIDQLKGKEMILKQMEDNSGTNSVTPFGGSTTTTPSDVYTSERTITLTAVK